MKPALLIGAWLALLAPTLCAATDTGWQLTATAQDFPHYFPTQLGNGYVATFSDPRGTVGTLSYLVGLMDETPGDIARPAAVPGWMGIDYSTGDSPAGHFWLNQAAPDPATFRDYRQVLDLQRGVLTTRYRYLDHGRTTAIAVTSFVSQADPHLAVTQLAITPEYDGVAELSFTLGTWAPHQPRLPLARLDGPQMQEALVANNLALRPIPPATADRAALWYHGDVQVLATGSDAPSLTMALDGRAAHGPRMALAVAVGLSANARPSAASYRRDDYRMALDLRVPVRKGRTYVFTKYVALSRNGWGGDAQADLALAKAARGHGFAALLDAQTRAWAELWRSDIEIDGDPAAQRMVHADLYYLLSNVTPDTAWATGACGLTTGYAGHVFWDSDTWVMPALLLLHPARAKSLVAFRDRTLPAAQARAQARGLRGAMYPWEADPQTGTEQTPYAAHVLGEREIHVTADVAIAQWQYWLASGDRDWLERKGWPVIRAVADFWASRATWVPARRRYEITHVTSVDEDYNDVPNDTYTNLAAIKSLRIAVAAAKATGADVDPQWAKVADGLYVPMATDGSHHLDFDPSVPHDLDTWGGSSLPMLFLPSLDLAMSPARRRANYAVAAAQVRSSTKDPNSMGLAPLSIAAATAGATADADAWFERNLHAHVVQPPFDVRTETANNNTGYFLTAGAGMLQNILYGFTGLRLRAGGLVPAYPPMLPARWRALTLHNIALRGNRYDIVVHRDAGGTPVLSMHPAPATKEPRP